MERSSSRVARRWGLRACAVAVAAGCLAVVPVRAAETVVGVAAVDGYADLKKQLRWVGTQIGNPGLEGMAESFVLMATQFKGLAGLDVGRPVGIVFTAADGGLSGHAFVPVKDLDRLLESLAGVIGPVDRSGGVRRVAPPGGIPFEIVERDGWAVVSPPGATCPVEDPMPFFGPLLKASTLGIEAYPAKMPPALLEQLRQALGQAASMAAAQGQQVDPEAVDVALDALDDVESLRWAIDIDTVDESLSIENAQVAKPGSKAAALLAGDVAAPLTVATGSAGENPLPAAAGHWCVKAAASIISPEAVDAMFPAGDGNPSLDAMFGLIRDLVRAMAGTGAMEAAVTLDTSAATADDPVPALTLGARLQDGAAFETQVKNRLGADGILPPEATLRFDAGRAGEATLHVLEVAGLPGVPDGRIEATVAIAPGYVFVLTGDDVERRVAAALAASGRPQPGAEPLGDVTIGLAPLLDYVARLAPAVGAGEAEAAAVEMAADVAAGEPAATLTLSARPIDRGARYRLRADGGALKTIAALVTAAPGVQPAGAGGLAPRPRAPALAP